MTCVVASCDRKRTSRIGYCPAHLERVKKHGTPLAEKPLKRIGRTSLCCVDGCDRPRRSKEGYCGAHLGRFKRGMLNPAIPIGARYTGAFMMNGYRWVKSPAATRADGYIAEHRLVMQEHMGRALRDDETVHHKNGMRDDDRIENLELWSRSHPYGQRVEDLVTWAREILERYEDECDR